MPVTGPLYPGSVLTTNNSLLNLTDWTNATNVEADDGAVASVALAASGSSGAQSYYVKCTNFGFSASIPSTATILGIQVDVKKSSSSSGSVSSNIVDALVQLLYGAGTLPVIGSDMHDGTTVWPGSLAYESYGASNNLWSAGPTAAMVRDTTWGVAVRAANTGSGAGTGNIDAVRMWIWWSTGRNPPILSGGQLTQYGIRTGGRLYRHATYSFPARNPGIILPDRRIHRCQTLAAKA